MFCVPVAAPLITIVTEDIAVADAKSTTSLGVRPSRLRARGASVERPVRNDAASTIRSTLPTATADNVTTAREEERPIDTNSQLDVTRPVSNAFGITSNWSVPITSQPPGNHSSS